MEPIRRNYIAFGPGISKYKHTSAHLKVAKPEKTEKNKLDLFDRDHFGCSSRRRCRIPDLRFQPVQRLSLSVGPIRNRPGGALSFPTPDIRERPAAQPPRKRRRRRLWSLHPTASRPSDLAQHECNSHRIPHASELFAQRVLGRLEGDSRD